MPCEFWIDLGSAMSCAEYEVDPDDLSAATVAAKIGIPPEQLFKTLAVQGDRNGIYLAVIPRPKSWTSGRSPKRQGIGRSTWFL
jgi:prolyl-tRNA editing enzyme YbaK/EbsC (Cys-tRNA(Pro) deacylase)